MSLFTNSFLSKKRKEKEKTPIDIIVSFVPLPKRVLKFIFFKLSNNKKRRKTNAFDSKNKKYKLTTCLTKKVAETLSNDESITPIEIVNQILNEIIDSAIKKSISVEEEVKAKIKDLFKIDNKKIPSSTYQIKNFSLMLTPPQMKFMFSPQINNTYNQNIFIINPVSPFNQQNQTLYSKLSKDLFTLTTKTEMNNFFLFKIKQSVRQIVKEIAVKSFSSAPFTQYKISYDLYGSFATGLNIETSDIDFMVKFMNKEDITLQLLTQLTKDLTESKTFRDINPITSAKIPVIKLEYDIASHNPSLNTILEKTGIKTVKLDITFHNVYFSSFIPAIELVKYIKSSIFFFPISKCIIFFMKKFLSKKKLNNYYKGGLSSYSLFVLLFAYIKFGKGYMIYTKDNIGILFVQFLEFYSKFNFYKYGINLNMTYPFFTNEDFFICEYPVIIDPITSKNIGSGTYRIRDIQEEFSKLAKELKEGNLKNENILSSYVE